MRCWGNKNVFRKLYCRKGVERGRSHINPEPQGFLESSGHYYGNITAMVTFKLSSKINSLHRIITDAILGIFQFLTMLPVHCVTHAF